MLKVVRYIYMFPAVSPVTHASTMCALPSCCGSVVGASPSTPQLLAMYCGDILPTTSKQGLVEKLCPA